MVSVLSALMVAEFFELFLFLTLTKFSQMIYGKVHHYITQSIFLGKTKVKFFFFYFFNLISRKNNGANLGKKAERRQVSMTRTNQSSSLSLWPTTTKPTRRSIIFPLWSTPFKKSLPYHILTIQISLSGEVSGPPPV